MSEDWLILYHIREVAGATMLPPAHFAAKHVWVRLLPWGEGFHFPQF